MSYETARNHEIHDAHQRLIDAFAKSYRCGQPTIVLLPGGMGSPVGPATTSETSMATASVTTNPPSTRAVCPKRCRPARRQACHQSTRIGV